MSELRKVKKYCSEIGGQRERGRPKTRSQDGVKRNLRRLMYRSWKAFMQKWYKWRKVVEEAKVYN